MASKKTNSDKSSVFRHTRKNKTAIKKAEKSAFQKMPALNQVVAQSFGNFIGISANYFSDFVKFFFWKTVCRPCNPN